MFNSFKVEPIRNLEKYCKEAYNYFFYQLRHDLLLNQLPNIDFKTDQSDIFGFCSVDM